MSELLVLIKAAQEALGFSQPRYSNFSVGVAVQTESGRVYKGSNFENPSLMMSLCAEKVAILKALSEVKEDIKKILILSQEDEYCYPCGSCRQFIYEFCPQAEIYLYSSKGIKKYTIEELLPHAFKR
ncbi:MAG: cytidine deaminase [Nitrospirae bacterium]|nr:MAG: cytidine deaminase [Nitrospirota bacterium]